MAIPAAPKTPEVAHSMPQHIPVTPGQVPRTPRTPGGKTTTRFYPVVKETVSADPQVNNNIRWLRLAVNRLYCLRNTKMLLLRTLKSICRRIRSRYCCYRRHANARHVTATTRHRKVTWAGCGTRASICRGGDTHPPTLPLASGACLVHLYIFSLFGCFSE